MKFSILISVMVLVLFNVYFAVITPTVFAQGGNDGQGGSSGSDGQSAGNDTASQQSVKLDNPLQSDSLTGFFEDLLDVVMVFAIPLIVFFIIFAGFKYVMAQGKPDEISTANRALLFALIGGVLILGANVILAVISGTIGALGS